MANAPRYIPLLVGIGGLLFGALFAFIGLHLWRDGKELRRNGVTVVAIIQKKFRKQDDNSWGGLENYYLQCAVPGTDGKTNQIELKVQSKQWRQLKENGPVALTWIPGNLESIKIGPLWARKLRGVIGIVMIIVGAGAAIVFPIGGLMSLLRART